MTAAPALDASLGRRAGAASALFGFSLLLFLITAATFSSLGVILPQMVGGLRWSWTEAGLGFTLLGAACGASAPLPALLIRRIGVRWTLALGAAAMAAGFACLAACAGLPLYLIGCTLLGVAFQMTALIPGTHVLAAAYPRPAFAFGVYFTAGSLGGVAGPLAALAYLAATHGGWRSFWVLQGLLSLLAAGLCVLLIGGVRDGAGAAEPDGPGPPPGRSFTLAEALRTRPFWVLLLAYFAHLLCGVTVASVSVAHLVERGVSANAAGGFLSLESLMGIIGRLAGGALADRIDPKKILLAALGLMAAGLLALSRAGDGPLLWIYAAGTGLGFGLTALSVTVLILDYFGRDRNLEIFSTVCLIGAVSAFGPVLAGAARDRFGGFGAAFDLFALICLAALAAALFMRRPDSGPA